MSSGISGTDLALKKKEIFPEDERWLVFVSCQLCFGSCSDHDVDSIQCHKTIKFVEIRHKNRSIHE
jgi:hypothetical protein